MSVAGLGFQSLWWWLDRRTYRNGDIFITSASDRTPAVNHESAILEPEPGKRNINVIVLQTLGNVNDSTYFFQESTDH